MSYLKTGGLGKEGRTNKLPPTGRNQQRSEGDTSSCVLPTSQNPPCWGPSWLNDAHATGRTLSQSDQPETTQKLSPSHRARDREPRGWAVLLGPLTLLIPSQRVPFPTKSLAFSARVSSWTMHTLRPWKRSSFLKQLRNTCRRNRV